MEVVFCSLIKTDINMKTQKQKKQIPADFRKQMYENHKANMAFYGKPVSPYKQWLKDVFNTKIPTK